MMITNDSYWGWDHQSDFDILWLATLFRDGANLLNSPPSKKRNKTESKCWMIKKETTPTYFLEIDHHVELQKKISDGCVRLKTVGWVPAVRSPAIHLVRLGTKISRSPLGKNLIPKSRMIIIILVKECAKCPFHDLHSLHIVFMIVMIAGFIMELSPFPSGFGRPPPEPLRGTQLLCGRPGGAIVQNVMGMASEMIWP